MSEMQLDHKTEMIRRREGQRRRIPMSSQQWSEMWERLNMNRVLLRMPPIKFKFDRSRYTGERLRGIRARTVNFKGELQR